MKVFSIDRPDLDERQRFLLYRSSHQSSMVVLWALLAGIIAMNLLDEPVAGLALVGVKMVMVFAQLTFLSTAKVDGEIMDAAYMDRKRSRWGWLVGWSVAFGWD